MRCNCAMDQRILREIGEDSALAPKIVHWIGSGLKTREGIVTTAFFYRRRGNLNLSNCVDETGLECAMNEMHIDAEGVGKDLWLVTALGVAKRFCVLPKPAGVGNLRHIISIEENSCVYRFHMVRPGQAYLAEDIESYVDALLWFDS